MAKKKIGNQHPTQSLFLPYEHTQGPEAIDYYEWNKRKVQQWQISLLEQILSTNAEGLWVHTKYSYAVQRRNGRDLRFHRRHSRKRKFVPHNKIHHII